MNTTHQEFEDDTKSLGDLVKIVKRRVASLVIPTVAISILAVLVALLLPATYESTATILIEEQEIPREFVRSTITSYAAQQIQVISQRILTVENINNIANKYNLYLEDDGSRLPSTEIALLFREDMSLDLVSADVIDPRSGRPTEATIAFTLSYESPSASAAQRVANELVTLFLDENLRNRTDKAASTAAFLEAEATSLNNELLDLEARLAVFKEDNEGSLPELYQFNLSSLERTSREASDIDLRIKELDKRDIDLLSQLAQLSPSAPVVLPDGQTVLGDADRLKSVRSEYRRKSALYKPGHPDLVRLKRELADLESLMGPVESKDDILKERAELNDQLVNLKTRFADSHPQIASTQRQIKALNERLTNENFTVNFGEPQADNPAYVFVQTQLNSNASEKEALIAKQADLRTRAARSEMLLSRAPQVEKNYQAMLRQHDNTNFKYQDLVSKQREAQLAENLEQEQKGERYILVEPPALPLEPASPNRPAIAFLGLIFAMGSGIGLVSIKEALDESIHGEQELRAVTGTPPFAVIPYIETQHDLVEKQKLLRRWITSVGVGGLALLLGIHIFFKPLDVIWFMFLNAVSGN